MRTLSMVPAASLLALAACGSHAAGAMAPASAACGLDAAWVQQVLDLWERSTTEVLQVPSAPLPYMVYFDHRCSYDVNAPAAPGPAAQALPPLRFRGAPVSVWATVHGGAVRLPDEKTIGPHPYAAGSMYHAPDPTPFYAMALMDVWRTELPADKQGEHLADEFLTIAQHELTHTLQLRGIFALAQRLAERGDQQLRLDDDAIQRTFEGDAEYTAVYDAEVKLLFDASLVTDAEEQRRMVRRAVELARGRQARWFVGEHALHAQLDGRFLAMEGLGEWVRYRLMTSGPVGELPRQSRAQVLARLRGKKPYWSQDEGLAVLLVLEQRLPDFRARLLADELPDAFALLDESTR